MDLNPSFASFATSRPVRYAVIAVLVLLSLFLLAKTWQALDAIGQVDTANIATITVTGTGKASTPPTIATISFAVQENGATVSAAQDAATKRTNDALAALKNLGIADKDVQTGGYSVTPQYEQKPCAPGSFCPQDTSKIVGYQVSQSVDVKMRDTSKAGDVLAALGKAGVQNVTGPNFAVDDPTAVEADARGKAIADAKQKAQMLAKQLGVHLGKVVGFSESGNPVPYFAKAAAVGGAGDASVAPTLPTGENETTSNVTVVYEIR